MIKILTFYFLFLNLAALFLMASDKRKAQKGRWRIAEKTLFGFALFGGSVGIFLGMYLFHHKTRKPLFRFGIPAVNLNHIFVVAFLFYHQNIGSFY